MMVFNGTTDRYKHKLCHRCAVCVENRPVSIQAASTCFLLTALEIRKTKT